MIDCVKILTAKGTIYRNKEFTKSLYRSIGRNIGAKFVKASVFLEYCHVVISGSTDSMNIKVFTEFDNSLYDEFELSLDTSYDEFISILTDYDISCLNDTFHSILNLDKDRYEDYDHDSDPSYYIATAKFNIIANTAVAHCY